MPEGRRVGRYEILSELGRGGMARVHLARQLDLDRFVALKELLALQREDAEMVGRFLRESRLAGALNHPSIVTVLDFFEHDDVRYIAMEYVPRGSLRPWVGHVDLARFGGVLESVLAGLAHAHAAGVVHRDLKPENLMVTADGRVKIADFGIAKAVADQGTTVFRTATGVAVGTPVYMAPEQAMAQDIGPWTDLYATGVIAYELLSGSVPFGGNEPLAVLLAHFQQEPPPLGDRAPDVPEPIAGWVHRLLAKEPGDRPESARAAWEDLEEHLLELIGPRWRRGARLEGEPDAPAGVSAETPAGRPVTPAHFPPDPAPPTTDDDDAWVTVAGDARPTPEPVEVPRHDEPSSATAPRPVAPPPTAPDVAPRGRGRPRGLLVGAGLAVVAAVVAVVVLVGGGGEEESPGARASSAAPVPPGSEAAPLGDDWVRAVHVISYVPDGLAQPEFADVLRQAKSDGATHVVLRPLLQMPSASSSELSVMADGPTDEAIAAGMDAAAREGLQTIIEPQAEPEGEYAGVYDPDDPDAFFAAYEERIAAYADIAGEHGAYGFVVGAMFSQLDGPDHTDRWVALLGDARDRCGCQVTYAAENVDGAERVRFWAAADFIGVNQIDAVAEEPTTDPAVIAQAWSPVKDRLEALSTEWDKPVALVELGYEPLADQAARGATAAEGESSQEAQAALFEGAFRAFVGTPWFTGIGWYELNDAPTVPGDFSFAGKQAEKVLRAWQTAR